VIVRRTRRVAGFVLVALSAWWLLVRRRVTADTWTELPSRIPDEPGRPGELPADVLATDAGLTEVPSVFAPSAPPTAPAAVAPVESAGPAAVDPVESAGPADAAPAGHAAAADAVPSESAALAGSDPADSAGSAVPVDLATDAGLTDMPVAEPTPAATPSTADDAHPTDADEPAADAVAPPAADDAHPADPDEPAADVVAAPIADAYPADADEAAADAVAAPIADGGVPDLPEVVEPEPETVVLEEAVVEADVDGGTVVIEEVVVAAALTPPVADLPVPEPVGIDEPTAVIPIPPAAPPRMPSAAFREARTMEVPAVTDDLRAVRGIGPSMERMLHSLGIVSFRQLALLDGSDLQRVRDELRDFRTRIEREDWVGQARALHKAKYGMDPA
jgi:predicted flap endonuclease-1-like 5' DNA nuclease